MLTLIDGTKLPSHKEIYLIFDKLFEDGGHQLRETINLFLLPLMSKRVKEDIDFNFGLKDTTEGKEFIENISKYLNGFDFQKNFDFQNETGDWDIVLENRVFRFFIEYKSNVNEWHKKIDDFLRQINKRHIWDRGQRKNVEKILLTLDKRFEKYKSILKRNNIRLIVLEQNILKKKNEKTRT